MHSRDLVNSLLVQITHSPTLSFAFCLFWDWDCCQGLIHSISIPSTHGGYAVRTILPIIRILKAPAPLAMDIQSTQSELDCQFSKSQEVFFGFSVVFLFRIRQTIINPIVNHQKQNLTPNYVPFSAMRDSYEKCCSEGLFVGKGSLLIIRGI